MGGSELQQRSVDRFPPGDNRTNQIRVFFRKISVVRDRIFWILSMQAKNPTANIQADRTD
jgi:hypothetical protein